MSKMTRQASPITFALSSDFATLSGDWNPLHMEPEYARRLQFGSSVVHGLHAMLVALEALYASQTHHCSLQKLDVMFNQPLQHGKPFTIIIENTDKYSFTIKVSVEKKQAIKITGSTKGSE
ncbi:MAG: hypothetical protein HQL70_08530, partial [Magnetococcales bacterium]|nr:hypothetical protein [Magnetococcales bacterium]